MLKKSFPSFLVSCFLLSTTFVWGTDFHGVCVGISEYPPPNQLPDDCVWDAEDMEDKLIDYQGWSDSKIKLITDGDAEEWYIKDRIQAMPRSAGHTDLFFFSGHGSASGLVTVDEEYISPSELQSTFGSSYNQYCCFLDACESGVFPDYMTKGVISSACKADEYAYCGGPDGHSIFTAYLCRGLKNNAADPDDFVSAEELHNYAAPRTTTYAQSEGYSMHPQLEDNYSGDLNLTAPLTITPFHRYVYQYAGTTTYTIENEGGLARDWSVNNNTSWVTISPDSGTLGGGQSQTLTVTYTQNYSSQQRTCIITLTYYVISSTVSLTQYEHTTTSGTLSHDETWRGNITLTGDVTVPSGITLTIVPGTEITFPSGKELYVYGTLLAEGTLSKRIVFNSQSQNSHIVRFNNSSSNGSRLNYCTLQYSNKGIYIDQSNPLIKNSEIRHCYYGIYNNQGRPLIDNNDISDCSYGIYNYNSQGNFEIKNNSINHSAYGIYNYSASPDIHSNEMYGGAFGLRCNNYSSPVLCGYSQPGYNYVHEHFMVGLLAEYNSNPFLGSDFCCLYGYNSFVNNTEGQISAGSGCEVIAETNWWGTSSPPSWWFSGNVDYIPYLTEPPSGGKGIKSPEEEAFDIAFGDELPIDKDNKNDDVMSYFDPDWSLIQQLRFAHTLIYNNYPEYACEICKNVIKTYPDSLQTLFALDLLWQASRLPDAQEGYDMETFEGYLYHLSEIEEKKILYGSVELLLAFFKGETGTPRIDKVFKEYRDTFLAEVALFQKFMYYFNEEDMENTIEVLNQLDYYFPGSSSAIQAHHLLGDEVGWGGIAKLGKADQSGKLENTAQIPERFELLGSYPNPFSPSTTIRYPLPCFSKVEVTVFNSSGQVINHFTIPSKPAGTHQLTWNGTDNKGVDVPSGIYFINFKATPIKESGKKFSKTVKLTLLR